MAPPSIATVYVCTLHASTPFLSFFFGNSKEGKKGGSFGSSHLSLPPTHRTRAGRHSPRDPRAFEEEIRSELPQPDPYL